MQLTNIVWAGALFLAVSHAFALPRSFDAETTTGELVESSEPTVDNVGDGFLGEEVADEFAQRDGDAVDEVLEEETAFEDEASVEEEAEEDLDLGNDAAGANATVSGTDEDPFLQLGEWPEPLSVLSFTDATVSLLTSS